MNTLSSFMGAWLALVLFCVAAVLVGIGLVAKVGISGAQREELKKGSVLVIELAGALTERDTPQELDYVSILQGEMGRPQTLVSLVSAIKEAKKSKNISAIYLKCQGISASPATLNALREALNDFRLSGKEIFAYGDSYAMGDYFVASVADKMYLNPAGAVELKGLGGTSLFFKNLLDKIGVDFQVVKVGTYKSAVEPYIQNEMSEPARAQLDTLYGNMWASIRDYIHSSPRGLLPSEIDSLINYGYIFLQDAKFDLRNRVVDQLEYERNMDSIIAKAVNTEVKKLNYVTPSTLLTGSTWGTSYGAKNKVAVLYAVGEIVDGGKFNNIDYNILVPQIVKLADDETVKGMVLRVNSPGGSVFGSDQIGEALDYFQSKGKTLAVSMGDYAASGGYWISCCADRIFADQLTITGSIGVFGLIPNFKGLTEKIGVNPQTVATNPNADFPNTFRPMNDEQKNALQKSVDQIYDQFVARVARGRKMSEAEVRKIGEGRVWDAQKAREIGLIDQFGSLEEAVTWVASQSKIENKYDVALYPQLEPSVWDVLPELAELKNVASDAVDNDRFGEIALKYARKILSREPVQARMPEIITEFK